MGIKESNLGSSLQAFTAVNQCSRIPHRSSHGQQQSFPSWEEFLLVPLFLLVKGYKAGSPMLRVTDCLKNTRIDSLQGFEESGRAFQMTPLP